MNLSNIDYYILKSGAYEQNVDLAVEKGFCYIATPPHYDLGCMYKIGKTKNIMNRIHSLGTASPEPFKLFMLIKTNNMSYCEKHIHSLLEENHCGHEFYELYEDEWERIRDTFSDRIILDFEPEGKFLSELSPEQESILECSGD